MAAAWTASVGLRSRLARRLLGYICAATALPIAIAAALTYRHLLLEQADQHQQELTASARYLGLSLLADLQRAADRLESETRLLHERPQSFDGRLPERLQMLFSSIELRDIQGTRPVVVPDLFLNRMQTDYLDAGKPVMWIGARSGVTPVVQIVLLDAARDHVVIGTIDPSILNEQVISLAGDAIVAITDTRGEAIWASGAADLRAIAEQMRELQVEDGRYTGASWDLFMNSAFAAEPLRVVVIDQKRNLFGGLGGLQMTFPLVMVAGLLIAVWITLIIVRRYIEPLHALSKATESIASQKFDVSVDIAGNDELTELGHAFNRMSGELRQQFQSLEILSEVDRMLLESYGLESVLGSLLPRIADVVGCSAVSVVLRDEDSDDHARVYSQRSGDEHGQRLHRLRLDWGAIERIIGHRRMCRSDELASEVQELLAALDVGAQTTRQIWSLRTETSLSGLLCFEFADESSERLPSAAHVRDFADRIAVAVRNLQFTRQLYQKGHFDNLTGLPNRALFNETLQATVAAAVARKQTGALLYLDLDSFKQVNDTGGHAAGDRLLEQSAGRMRACLSEGEMIARLGGDEFAVLLPDVPDPGHARVVATRILAALAAVDESLRSGARPVTASIGICLFPADGQSAGDLLKHSDIAMYRAKESNSDSIVFFAAEMQERMHHRAALEFGLRNAIARNELQLYYQPIYRGARLCGGEALLRWFTADGEQISPAAFIPIAEDSGLIHEIGRWVLQEACRHYAAWTAQGVAPEYLSINVAPEQLTDPQFVETVKTALASNRIEASSVQLEITESALADGSQAEQRLDALAALGVRLALDDFGTGYSSLGHLHRLPISVIKIDRAFIMHVPQNPRACQLLTAIVQMGQGLDKGVIAEGVETQQQFEFLQKLGCETIQGFLRGRPVPATQYGHLLAQHVSDSSASTQHGSAAG
jgi:diguanylate cyclase (GGDEF)-like protein